MRWILPLLVIAAFAGERAPRANELPAYPEDGQTVAVNPPGFYWTPSDSAAAYRLEVYRDRKLALTKGPLASTVCPPWRKLARPAITPGVSLI